MKFMNGKPFVPALIYGNPTGEIKYTQMENINEISQEEEIIEANF